MGSLARVSARAARSAAPRTRCDAGAYVDRTLATFGDRTRRGGATRTVRARPRPRRGRSRSSSGVKHARVRRRPCWRRDVRTGTARKPGHTGLVIRWESRLSGWKLWRAGASNSCPVPRVARSAHAWHAAQATREPSATRAVRLLACGVARVCVAVPGGRLRLANFVYRPTKRRREVHVRGATVCWFPVSSCSGLGADARVVCLHRRQTRRGHAELRMLACRHVPVSLRAWKRMCRRVRVVRPAGATPGARGSSVRHFSREASHTGQDACMHTRDLEDARARRASFAGISRSCMRPASRRATGAPVHPYRHQTPSV